MSDSSCNASWVTIPLRHGMHLAAKSTQFISLKAAQNICTFLGTVPTTCHISPQNTFFVLLKWPAFRPALFWPDTVANQVSICWRLTQGVNNRWNRWSENQLINRWQSMPLNWLILIIDEQSMLEFYVIIDFINCQFLLIINTNRSVNLHRLSSIGCHFLCVLFSVRISKTRWNFNFFTIDTS